MFWMLQYLGHARLKILDGGWATVAYGVALNALAAARQDCFAILSTPFSDEDASTYITDITAYRDSELNINGSYSGLWTPHVYITDKFNSRKIYVAPDGYMGAIISKTGSNFDLWLPPAGFEDRCNIPVENVRRRFDQGEMDTLYDAGINPIRFKKGKGIRPWGQKTLLTRPSSLDRINVRMLLLVIEPAVKEAMEDFLFKLNDTTTRALATSIINAFMEGILARGGVTDYRTQIDTQNNTPTDIANNIMNVALFVVPTRAVETIPIKIILTNPGSELSLG